MDADKLAISTTTDGKPPAEGMEHAGAPQPIGANSQHGAYWVLKPEERAKGFVRPVRDAYVHVGKKPARPLRDLTAEELTRYAAFGYVKYEAYPESESPVAGRFWTAKDLASGCGGETRMGSAIAETWARNVSYYGSTFCVRCRAHLPVDEFVWSDTDERLGT